MFTEAGHLTRCTNIHPGETGRIILLLSGRIVTAPLYHS